MSSTGNGSAGSSAAQSPVFQQLTPLGTNGGQWLGELKGLGYMPTGQSGWGNIGTTTNVAPTQNAQNPLLTAFANAKGPVVPNVSQWSQYGSGS